MKNLKKYTWLLLAGMLSIHSLFAQTADEGASLGIKLGVNVTGYNLKEASLKIAPGFNLGIFSNVALSKYFSLQPEINLNVQNSHITVTQQLSDVKFNMLLSYVELAISGRVRLGRLYLQGGPDISYLANASITNNTAINDVVTRNNFYDIDFGFVYSAGLQTKRWDLGLRYNNGMYKIGKPLTPDNKPNIFRETKTSSFQLYAGYYF